MKQKAVGLSEPKKLHPSIEPSTPPSDEAEWRLVGYTVDGTAHVFAQTGPRVRARTAFAARAMLASTLPPEVSTQSIVVEQVEATWSRARR